MLGYWDSLICRRESSLYEDEVWLELEADEELDE